MQTEKDKIELLREAKEFVQFYKKEILEQIKNQEPFNGWWRIAQIMASFRYKDFYYKWSHKGPHNTNRKNWKKNKRNYTLILLDFID